MESELTVFLIGCGFTVALVFAMFLWSGIEWYAALTVAFISPLVYLILYPLAGSLVPPGMSIFLIKVIQDLGVSEKYGPEVSQMLFSGTVLSIGTFWLTWKIRGENRLDTSEVSENSEH